MNRIMIVIGCVCLWTACAYAEPVEVELPQRKILASTNGRFVFGQISNARRDQFLFDTQTGRLWQMVVDRNDRNMLQPVPIIQVFGEEAYIPDPYEDAKSHHAMACRHSYEELDKEKEQQKSKFGGIGAEPPDTRLECLTEGEQELTGDDILRRIREQYPVFNELDDDTLRYCIVKDYPYYAKFFRDDAESGDVTTGKSGDIFDEFDKEERQESSDQQDKSGEEN